MTLHLSKYLTVTECADIARLNRETIAIALREGRLHGFQRKEGKSNWSIREGCLEAWIEARQCEHQLATNSRPLAA